MTPPANPAWLSPPYYTRDPEVRIDIPWYGSVPNAESQMQTLVSQLFTWVNGFVWGGAGEGADTVSQFQAQILKFAADLKASPVANLIAADFDPTARGEHYFRLVVETLQRIPANRFDWTQPANVSVYDVWVAKAGV